MIQFSERKEQNDRLEEQIFFWKQEYQKPEMSKEQYHRLLARMEEAKKDKKQVFLAAFIVVPNTSAKAAEAMGRLPVIGRLVEAVTFRNYTYESDRNMADIKVPKLQLGEQAGGQSAADKGQADGDGQQKLQSTTKEINAEIQKITDELVADFEANLAYEGGYQDLSLIHI